MTVDCPVCKKPTPVVSGAFRPHRDTYVGMCLMGGEPYRAPVACERMPADELWPNTPSTNGGGQAGRRRQAHWLVSQAAKAVALCRNCSEIQPCAATFLQDPTQHGIWAGEFVPHVPVGSHHGRVKLASQIARQRIAAKAGVA